MKETFEVSELVGYIKRQLEDDLLLSRIQVTGEVSNFKRHSSGHLYFTLKDSNSRMKAVMFARDAAKLADIKDGMHVVVTARVSVYIASGEMQLYIEEMTEEGVGVLFEAFNALKNKLESRGWFDPEQKRMLPRFPERIGIITSPKGAALHDIATTLRRRFPQGAIVFAPVLVQGKDAAPQIARAIREMNALQACDVMIIGRGGGSIEELWAFNEEVVAQAIHESVIPVVSAVGHETDFTISDFVADVRAATPTGAAELVTPEAEKLTDRLSEAARRLDRSFGQFIAVRKERVERQANSYGLKSPRVLLGLKQEQLDRAEMELLRVMRTRLDEAGRKRKLLSERLERVPLRQRMATSSETVWRLKKELGRVNNLLRSKQESLLQTAARLESVSPMQVLLRGYTFIEQDGKLVRSKDQLTEEPFTVRFHDGVIRARRED
ncbi:exodeoxyribonuclease VII large subunit [Exiguobacterium flavidum]|uniref:exodeoxyribonuclease VII large subunit n=1 Tax=Exiguobacterium flavidum TaxID=2184695 RepID=UPI0018E5976C|nr:exodeoxyribonuclease VII large subunit [Exiguobacterium flavidum]